MNHLVSVIIPTYNHAHFLGRALQSLRDQTYHNWEAIVVDNYSQDETEEVIEKFGDNRIHLLKIHNHGVIAASRNRGISQAKGEWLAFLDSDDFWDSAKLDHCIAYLNRSCCDLVCHGERWRGNGRDREVFYGPESRASYESLLFKGNCISTSAVVVRRKQVEAVSGFCEEPDIITAEDYDLWLRLARNGVRAGFLPEILGEYTIHSDSQSHAVLRNMKAVMKVVRSHFAETGDLTVSHRLRLRRREAIVYYGAARGFQEADKHGEAWPYFFRALFAWPFVPKIYAAMLLNLLSHRIV